MPALTLYHIAPSRSSTVLWMLEEIGEPYGIHLLSMKKGDNRERPYLDINPMGKVPALKHGDTVVTEHAETWHWPTGEQVTLPFVSVHEMRDGSIVRWWDYWDLQTLMNAAPAWWVEHIMQGYT